MSNYFSESDIDDLIYSEDYAEYIMTNGDYLCCDDDALITLQEEGYMLEEFLEYFEDVMREREAA